MKELIHSEHLTKMYGKQKAVDDVTFTLEKGDIYGLVGKNGAGKSTFFKSIMGLTNFEGTLTIMGASEGHDLVNARKNIGFMMSSNFFPYLNGHDNIEYFRKIKGVIDKKETDRVLKAVDLFGVKKPYKAYSMGMKQRLGLANALLGSPDIIILDEPTNGLDPQGIADFRTMVLELNHKHGITFVISSHILAELALMGTRFGIINQGQLIKEIDREQLRRETQSGLLIQVDDTPKATVVLEELCHVSDYQVQEDQQILIPADTDPAMVAKALVSNGIALRKLVNIESTLEDYFLKLTGGTAHA